MEKQRRLQTPEYPAPPTSGLSHAWLQAAKALCISRIGHGEKTQALDVLERGSGQDCAHLQAQIELVPAAVIHLRSQQEAAGGVLEGPAEGAGSVQGPHKICAALLGAPGDELHTWGFL